MVCLYKLLLNIIMSTKTVQESAPSVIYCQASKTSMYVDMTQLEPSCCTVLNWSQEVCSLVWFHQLHCFILFLSLFSYDCLFSFCLCQVFVYVHLFLFLLLWLFFPNMFFHKLHNLEALLQVAQHFEIIPLSFCVSNFGVLFYHFCVTRWISRKSVLRMMESVSQILS